MKTKLLLSTMALAILCTLPPVSSLAQELDERIYDERTQEALDEVLGGSNRCERSRTRCVDRCDDRKERLTTRYPPPSTQEAQDAREEARFCRRNCDSDFNACMGRRPEHWRSGN